MEIRATGKTARVSTTALAHSTPSRRGTAHRVAWIMPVVYSPLITSTPRMLTVSGAR